MVQVVRPVYRRVAILMSAALGDSLLMLIVAHNLRCNGSHVVVFGRQAEALRAWLPGLTVESDLSRDTLAARLAGFDTVVQLHADRPFADIAACHPHVVLLDHVPRAASSDAMVDRLAAFCRVDLQLPHVERRNGLTAPPGLVHRRHSMRVAIHPTASTPDKCWLPERFVRLGRALQVAGFEPQFVLAPNERAAWGMLEEAGLAMPLFGSLGEIAAWLYESAWFIGNDSGIGHLASNLDVPTLSLFMRRGIARTWRPAWGRGRVLVGGRGIPTARLRERYWKRLLSVSQVMTAFGQLQAEQMEKGRRQ